MTYNQVLSDLKKVGLKAKFISEFEKHESQLLIKMFKETDKIHSTGALVRILMKHYENESEIWLYWQKVLFYFMTPQFARIKNF